MGGRWALVCALLVVGCAGGDSTLTDGPALGDGTETDPSTATTLDPSVPTTATTDSMTAGPTTASGPTSTTQTTATSDSSSTGAACSDPQTWYRDQDDDGFGDPDETTEACSQPAGFVADMTDCDDGDGEVYPGANEPCGGPDVNCDFEAPALCQSCLAQLASGNETGDGLYSIDPDGESGALPQTQVWCDMITDGGGWTLVQRTVWDSAQTTALRTGYSSWYNQTIGSASVGMGYRLNGIAWPEFNTQLDHMLRIELREETDGTSCEPLFYIGTNGTLTADETTSGITGVISDVVIFNGPELSTLDTGPSIDCLVNADAIPWFYSSCCSTCPAYQGPYWTARRPMMNYSAVADSAGNTELEVCVGPAQPDLNGSSFKGANVMEYYLR